MRRAVTCAVACALVVFGGAHAADVPLCRGTDYINAQFVPTADIAKAIYKAIGRGLSPNFLKRYPIVVVEDGGDHWSVSQTDNRPPPKAGPNEVIVTAGGGELHMDIDKCSGAVSNAAFNR